MYYVNKERERPKDIYNHIINAHKVPVIANTVCNYGAFRRGIMILHGPEDAVIHRVSLNLIIKDTRTPRSSSTVGTFLVPLVYWRHLALLESVHCYVDP